MAESVSEEANGSVGTTHDYGPSFVNSVPEQSSASPPPGDTGLAVVVPGISHAISQAVGSGLGVLPHGVEFSVPLPVAASLPPTVASGLAAGALMTHFHAASWDPTQSTDWDNEKASQQCILRIKRDIMSIYKEPPPGMFVVPDPHDMTKIHALITGPFDTPYEGGFFLFLFRCPPDYPIHPPRVKLITTGHNTVRFNPNFYRSGKVCLSILG
ncbi:hypothetical protein DNTS_001710 [Danionella cerebrum]|nr:hypothetical protein DNTS_001710 [Danionella translucida]